MKSKFFSRFDVTDERNKSFSDDLKHLISIERVGLLKLVNELPLFLKHTDKRKKRQMVDKLSSEINQDFSCVETSLNILNFIFTKLQKEDLKTDTPELLADDLLELGILNKSQKNLFVEIIELLITDLRSSILKAQAERTSEYGILPTFMGIRTSVELRAIVENAYDDEQPVTDYKPNVLGFTPIVSILIAHDAENIPDYRFQATSEDIRTLIQELQAAIVILENIKAN